MLIAIISMVISLIVLIYSADKFVEGAANIATYFNVPNILVGVVIIGFGTSMPEMLVSALSALNGNPSIALGNAYGSNIANIGLILGLSVLLTPIILKAQVILREIPILIFTLLITFYFLSDLSLSRTEAVLLLIVFIIAMGYSIIKAKKNHELDEELEINQLSIKASIMWTIIGLVLLLVSSKFLVSAAVDIARFWGISDLVIGLTVVAVGTSLPELASSLAAIKQGKHDIVIGNIMGSNLFNTLVVVGITGVITPIAVEHNIISRDIPFMFIFTAILIPLAIGKIFFMKRIFKLSRVSGAILLIAYTFYNYIIFTSLSS